MIEFIRIILMVGGVILYFFLLPLGMLFVLIKQDWTKERRRD